MVLGLLCNCCTSFDFYHNTYENFLHSTVHLPDSVIIVRNSECMITSLPNDTLRLVYYYDKHECFNCAIVHAYELCNLFDENNRFIPIILFSPKEKQRGIVLQQLLAMNYDFPIYVTEDNDWVKKSSIPRNPSFHFFLLDKNGTPIFVGDPVRIDGDGDLFIKVLDSSDTQ